MTSHVSLVQVWGLDRQIRFLKDLDHRLTEKEDDNLQRWPKNVPA